MLENDFLLDKNKLYYEEFETFNFDEIEENLQKQLYEELESLEFLEEEKEKIGSPDALGQVILDEIWKQFGNQIGLDMTNETTIQKYDREHPEIYDQVGSKVMQDKRYKEANKEMRDRQEVGDLKDTYTGKNLGRDDKANLDHVVSRKEIFENKRRKQANLSTEELANKSENLKPTNESLNKSKGAKSIKEIIETRPEREKEQIKQNERANKKIDDSNMYENEKHHQKDLNNKRLEDKLDANDELMRKADKEARKSINKDIAKGATKEIGKKAGKDAIKQVAISALFSMLREIINGLVRFFKSATKSFKVFLEEMKESIRSFFSKITNYLKTGISSMIGTIVSEIFGPIVSVFKKLASMIKQGVASTVEAISYLKDKENKNKAFSLKVAEVGKIIIAGLVAGGALIFGEVFEKILLGIPGMQITLPLLGSLANVIGLFLASLVSGLIGAIVINKIDGFVEEKQKNDNIKTQIEKSNDVLITQQKIGIIKEVRFENDKKRSIETIRERHIKASTIMNESIVKIMENVEENQFMKENFDNIDKILAELEG